MKLLHTKDIPLLDQAAAQNGFSPLTLMERAGAGVGQEILSLLGEEGGTVLIFCGGGNNGGDGYAAATVLLDRGVNVLAIDAFGKGQRTEEGKHFLAAYTQRAGAPLLLSALSEEALDTLIKEAACLVDALFGTGFSGPLPPEALRIAKHFQSSAAKRLAVDIPLGVDGETGAVMPGGITVDRTVCLSFYKRGLFSYPAKEACGTLSLVTLEIPREAPFVPKGDTFAITEAFAKGYFAKRSPNTHKGSFGKAIALCGCEKYRGAACLAAEGALRTGVGLFTLAAEEAVLQTVLCRLPETVALPLPPVRERKEEKALLRACQGANALLVGCGCGLYPAVLRLILALLDTPGAPLILDADGINLLAETGEGIALLARCKRPVVLTPHPLELARLRGITPGEVQANRLKVAEETAHLTGATVVLKGAGTVVAAPGITYINTTGSPALSKGGSGDTLAGMLLSLCAQGISPTEAAALAVYLHGAAGDLLEKEFSDRGVLPQELPTAAARVICRLQG